MHRTLELAASLLDGLPRVDAEAGASDRAVAASERVVFGEDPLVLIGGSIDDGWPAGSVVPRRERRGLELQRVPHESPQWQVASVSAAASLDDGDLQLSLPLGKANGRAFAVLVASLVSDRMASAAGCQHEAVRDVRDRDLGAAGRAGSHERAVYSDGAATLVLPRVP